MKGILLCLALVLSVRTAAGAVLYVRADAAGPETNGLTWATAFNSIPHALQHAASGDELWVAGGTYTGSIEVPAGVALYGGFAGNETLRGERDWARNKTVIDWQQWGELSESYNEQFGPTVLLGVGSRLDGFTVINGWHSHASGIYAGDSGAIIANNIIFTNRGTGILPSAVLVDRTGQFDDGDDFFLKTANDLLRMQFPFGATNIPVSQYTPAVHRLLQVAANVYDGARLNVFPSVFRPQFAMTLEGPVISGYYEDSSFTNLISWLGTNRHAIPMIIGARKGFPNFNELLLETIVFAARKLEMRRLTTNSPPHQTNEMYVVGIENRVGLEAWNSYRSAYSNRLDIAIANYLTVSITNTDGLLFRTNHLFSVATSYETWPGFVRPESLWHPSNALSFKIPLFTNHATLSNGIYRAGPPGWIELSGNTNDFVPNSGFDTPEWVLTMSNDVVFVLHSQGRIIDFVRLVLTNSLGLTTNLLNPQSAPSLNEGPVALCWSTNRRGTSVYVPTEGVQQQIDISLGQVPISPSQWAEYANIRDPGQAISNFMYFVFPHPTGRNTNLIQQVPFTPARKLVISARWEANDPLVHALPEHLKDVTNAFSRLVSPFAATPMTNQSLLALNLRYRPWGGRPDRAPSPDDFDRRIKDAGLWDASHFDFPSDAKVNIDWLDRIHRGTPWQTLYFDHDAATWMRQSLDPGTHPTNDWKIIEYLRGRLSYASNGTPTRVVNNTIVGNEGGLWIATNASVSVMNNALPYNSVDIVDEGGFLVELSANCVTCSPQFVNAAAGDFSLLATSPLIDAGDPNALAWIERPVFGAAVDIGALEFGPDGVPVFTFERTSPTEHEVALHGYAGQSYVIEASTNLENWTPITTNVATMGSILLQDSAATNYTHRFYRAKVANHPN